MKKNTEQTGSAHIGIVIILVILVIGLLGFVFWNNVHGKNQTTQVVTDTNTSTSVKPNTTVGPIIAQESLSVNDWSIKFMIPAGLVKSDVDFYKVQVGEAPMYYGFTTNRVRAQGDLCDNQVTGNLITLNRSSTKNGNGTLINKNAIGGYYYYESSSSDEIDPTPECLTTSIAVQDHTLLDDMINSLSAL